MRPQECQKWPMSSFISNFCYNFHSFESIPSIFFIGAYIKPKTYHWRLSKMNPNIRIWFLKLFQVLEYQVFYSNTSDFWPNFSQMTQHYWLFFKTGLDGKINGLYLIYAQFPFNDDFSFKVFSYSKVWYEVLFLLISMMNLEGWKDGTLYVLEWLKKSGLS